MGKEIRFYPDGSESEVQEMSSSEEDMVHLEGPSEDYMLPTEDYQSAESGQLNQQSSQDPSQAPTNAAVGGYTMEGGEEDEHLHFQEDSQVASHDGGVSSISGFDSHMAGFEEEIAEPIPSPQRQGGPRVFDPSQNPDSTYRGENTLASRGAVSTATSRRRRREELEQQRKRMYCFILAVVIVWAAVAAIVGAIVGAILG